MKTYSRRKILGHGLAGLAAVCAAPPLVLAADRRPTPPSGGPPPEGLYMGGAMSRERQDIRPGTWAATEDNILGPYYRPGAPFRGKTTPPRAKGRVLLVRGRVWSYETRKPVSSARLDIWHADADGHYDNDVHAPAPSADVFVNRVSLVAGDDGAYEYEAVHPGAYETSKGVWRPSHIHYLVRAEGHKPLVTQLYFRGDPYNEKDRFIKQSLIIDVATVAAPDGGTYESGVFDIVLEADGKGQ